MAISIKGVTKKFGEFTAVDGLNLEIKSGEFFSMLGPSGSGKTTVLRMIAGFELPTAGTISLGGEDVTTKAPFDRDVNTVFQDYALFPHMSVAENVAYGLRVRGERNKRVLDDKVEHAIALWRRCIETNTWPGYPARICWAEPNPWSEARWQERQARDPKPRPAALEAAMAWQAPLEAPHNGI